MKCLVILALCLAAVVAEVAPDVQTRSKAIHEIHYSEHKQTVSDAQKELNQKLDSVQVAVEDDGQQLQSSLEEVDSYGVGTVTASQSGGESVGQPGGGPVYVGGSIGGSSSVDQQLTSGGAAAQGPYYVGGSSSGNNEHRWRQDSSRDQSFRYSGNGGHSTSGWGSPSIVIPVAGGGGTSESYSQRSEQRIEGSRAPILISSPSGGSSSYYHQRQQRIEQRPQAIVQISQPSGASESYTHTRTVQSQPQTVILSPGGGTSESYSHRSEKIVKSQPVPVLIAPSSSGSESLSEYKKFSQSQSSPLLVAPSYGHSSHLSLLGSTSQSRPSLQYIPSGSGSISSHSENLISESQVAPTVSAIIAPSTGGSSEYHYSHKSVSQAKPTYIVASPASSSSSHVSQSLTQQNSGSNLIPLLSGGGSSSLVSGSNLVSSHGLGGSYYPISTGGGVSSSLLAGSSLSNTGSSYVPILTGGGSSSHLSESLTSSQGSLGGSYVPVPIVGGGASSSLLSESSLRSSGSVGGYAPIPVVVGGGSSSSLVSGSSLSSSNSLGGSYVPVTSGALLSGNYGSHSSLTSGLGSYHNLHGGAQSNLLNYMTESERLARMQSQDIGVGGFLTGSSQLNLESRLGSSGSLGAGLGGHGGSGALLSGGHGGSGGGYSSKSWEKSSKWSSGTQYGPDGRPKSYNLLSTGEGEEHNINGYKAGFKAATTTIDDDGKVSTYSIHSK